MFYKYELILFFFTNEEVIYIFSPKSSLPYTIFFNHFIEVNYLFLFIEIVHKKYSLLLMSVLIIQHFFI